MGWGAASPTGELGEDGVGKLGKQVAGGDFQETVKPTLITCLAHLHFSIIHGVVG